MELRPFWTNDCCGFMTAVDLYVQIDREVYDFWKIYDPGRLTTLVFDLCKKKKHLRSNDNRKFTINANQKSHQIYKLCGIDSSRM